ncbi:helix-turn-helix domain-containing protein [Dysgonomonas sp. HGC4]|uniref:helix-turn-helix domain-containing protein n=1 Tax=Dysgonomonas sp. HGC4 TaxID=1658009 RepID=UPI00068276B3|nr:helix-turn-helix domain-containing protein [Dysgonomonas sp. HGC4]MBD8346378.1 helix-turn-helix transcriptional regulator [Dysgonomonas sp. HGC4]
MEATTLKGNNHGANVKRWREWRNIKQDVLADQIGVSQATLSGYEKKDKLEQEVLEKIAKVLGVPVEAITELGESTAINIINAHDNQSIVNYNPTFNPIDKIVELYNEKNALYERMLKEKEETISLLHEVLKEKK